MPKWSRRLHLEERRVGCDVVGVLHSYRAQHCQYRTSFDIQHTFTLKVLSTHADQGASAPLCQQLCSRLSMLLSCKSWVQCVP
jgi:hypothetical protein